MFALVDCNGFYIRCERVYAKLCMPSIFRDGYTYKKCGVSLNDLSSVDAVQLNFLASAVDLHDERLMEAIDTLNKRYGSGTIRLPVGAFQNGNRVVQSCHNMVSYRISSIVLAKLLVINL